MQTRVCHRRWLFLCCVEVRVNAGIEAAVASGSARDGASCLVARTRSLDVRNLELYPVSTARPGLTRCSGIRHRDAASTFCPRQSRD
jgi:hypothetical protein